MTNALLGNSFLLQVASEYSGSSYTTVAALKTTSLVINQTSVDVTNKGSSGWSEVLPGGGVTTMKISADGIYTDDATQVYLMNVIIGSVEALGEITLSAQPSNNDTIILNGITWKFVTSGATGNETDIQSSLPLTLAQLVSDLNASVVSALAVATYSTDSTHNLNITYDTVGQIGNTYTLATGVGYANQTLSAATLTGGRAMDTLWNFKLIDGGGHSYTGAFQVDSFTLTGPANAAETFSMSMTSSGAVTYA